MQIQELIQYAENKLARLNSSLNDQKILGNISEIERIETEILDTEQTLLKLRS
jgi:archaellum component FlaC